MRRAPALSPFSPSLLSSSSSSRPCSSLLFLSCALLLLVCGWGVGRSEATLAGFKTALSPNGIAYIKSVAMSYLEEYLSGIPVPTTTGKAHSSLGSIGYSIFNVSLASLKISTSDVILVHDTSSVQLCIANASSFVTVNWLFKTHDFPHFTDGGAAEISIVVKSVNISLFFGAISGHPYASAEAVEVQMGGIDIKIINDASWLYNPFVGDVVGGFMGNVASALSGAIKKAVNDGANKAFASIPIIEAINADLVLDYSLVEPPFVESHQLILAHKGEFYSLSHYVEAPFESHPLPKELPDTCSSMVTMYITDYVANTLAFAFFVEDNMKMSIDDSILPDDSPFRLNTTFFQEMIPPLYAAYPAMLLQLDMSATQPPSITFAASGATLRGKGVVDVYALPSNNLAFSLSVDLYCAGTAALSGMNITGSLKLVKVSFKLRSSPIGPFDVSVLQDIVNALFTYGVLPRANKFLHSGFALPSVQGISLVNPIVTWQSRYLALSADIVYTTGKRKFESEHDEQTLLST